MSCPECGHGVGYHYAEGGCFYGPEDSRDLSSPICSCTLSPGKIRARLNDA